MSRRSPLPDRRENLTQILAHVDRWLDYHAGLASDMADLVERARRLEPASRPIDDLQLCISGDRVLARMLRGVPLFYAFVDHLDGSLLSDLTAPGDSREPSQFAAIMEAVVELREALVAKIEATVAPDWIEGYRSELNQAFNVSPSYHDFFERAAERDEVEMEKGPKRRLKVRVKDPARHEEVWRNLCKKRNL